MKELSIVLMAIPMLAAMFGAPIVVICYCIHQLRTQDYYSKWGIEYYLWIVASILFIMFNAGMLIKSGAFLNG